MTDQPDRPIIRVAALVIRDRRGNILSVRKKDTAFFLLPGGKPEPGERPVDTALRELREETGLTVGEQSVDYVGCFSAPAANESGHTVVCDCFVLRGFIDPAEVTVAREIAEARFFAPDTTSRAVAPLSRDVIFPAVSTSGG